MENKELDREQPVPEPAPEGPAPVALVDDKPVAAPAPVSLADEPPLVKLAEETPAAQPKPNLLRWLFDPQTPRGQTNRAILRATALAVAMFGAGFLLGYLVLYLPLSQQVKASRDEAAALRAQLITVQSGLEDVRGKLGETESALTQLQAVQADTQARLEDLQIRQKLLDALYLATQARLDWMSNNQTETLTRLVEAKNIVEQIKPDIEAQNADLAALLSEQMSAAVEDITKKAPSAPSALEKLHRTLRSLYDLFEGASQ